MKYTNIRLFLLIVLIFNARVELSAQKVTVENGIRSVSNDGIGIWGDIPEITLKKAMTLGQIEGDDEGYIFFIPSDIIMDKNGDILVLDTGNGEVKKYTADGKFLLKYGRRGNKSNEFCYPVSFNLNSDNNILILDAGRNKFMTFSPEGKYINSFTWDDNIVPHSFLINSKNHLVMSSGLWTEDLIKGFFESQKNKECPLLVEYDFKGNVLNSVGTIDYVPNRMESIKINQGSFCQDADDNFYISFENKNMIEKYSPTGKLLMRINRPLSFETMTISSGSSVVSKAGSSNSLAKMNLVSKAIMADRKGRIWVATANRQMTEQEKVNYDLQFTNDDPPVIIYPDDYDVFETDMYDLEIYNTEGFLLGKIHLDHFVDEMKIIDDRIYILDRLRGMQFHVYQVIE